MFIQKNTPIISYMVDNDDFDFSNGSNYNYQLLGVIAFVSSPESLQIIRRYQKFQRYNG